jgi:hypothetical protein
MSESELLTIINSYVADGMEYQQSKLSEQIALSHKYYYGDPLGNEVIGRSSVVSKDVADAVDWIMPSLMRIFAGGKDVVDFIPETKDEVEVARQARDYVNYVYKSENEGFVNTYSVIQDALLAKNGIMKHYAEEKIELEFDNFEGLSAEQVELVLLDEGVELTAMTQLKEGVDLYDIEVSRQTTCKQIKVEAIPPEEFIIDTWSASIDEASFVGHRRLVSRSELVASGFDAELVYDLTPTSPTNLGTNNSSRVTRARNANDQAQFSDNFGSPQEASQEQLLVTEAIIKVDFDGDGLAERRRIVEVDGNILVNEKFSEPLFTDFRAHMIAHKFYGMSMYDQLKDIQKIKTTLLRNLLDNMYTLNNGRYEVIDGQVNMDDLLNNRLGGVVRTKMAGAIKQLDTPALPAQNFQMLQYLDTLKDNRTGVSNTTKGMQEGVLHSNQAGSAVADVMAAAEQKQELIARVLAHSFAKMFSNIYKLLMVHQDHDKVFNIRGEYVTTNPAKWRKSYRITPVPGIGDGKTAEKMMASQQMLNIVTMLGQAGAEGIIYDWNTVYDLLLELTQNSGFDEPQRFWLNPRTPEGQAAITRLQEMKSQPSADDLKKQAETQEIGQRVQLDAQQMKAEYEMKMAEMDVRRREAAVKEREVDLEQQKIELKRYEIEVKHAATVAEIQLEMSQGRPVGIGDRQIPNSTDGNIPSL